jgi:hypothetical protein
VFQRDKTYFDNLKALVQNIFALVDVISVRESRHHPPPDSGLRCVIAQDPLHKFELSKEQILNLEKI